VTTAQAEDIAEEIRTMLRWLTIAVVVCLVVAVGVGLFAITLASRVADQTDRTNAALCTFRADIETRAIQTEEFLREHPEGVAGIPAATLRQSLKGQRSTVAALGSLNCPPANYAVP
jgi:cell division protein FtsX